MDPADGNPPSSDEPTLSTGELEGILRDFTGVTGARAGDQVGPYRLLGLLGEGGFGEVWLAERREPFVQRVALKVIKPGMDSKSVIARFEQERQALAVMDHPNVAKVLDGGVTPPTMGSRPYFVMEHVQGEPITTYCDRHRLTIRQRLELFIPVCEAVQHAHHKGIIHRDIKPSNVLVSVTGDQSVPKVIDFGVAKAVNQTLTEKTIFTEQGQLIGTPEYMSPEQAEMGALDIDTRTDVYSLGVLLYELITGLLPFDRGTLRRAGLDEIRRVVRETEPPSPSKRLTTLVGDEAGSIAKARQSEREDLVRELRRELEWIPLRCLRKDRLRRYATCKDLAADIRRYMAGEALEAGPESRTYRTSKVLATNRSVVAVALVVLAVVAGAIGAGLALSGHYTNRTNAWHYVLADIEKAIGRRVGELSVVPSDVPLDPVAACEHPYVQASLRALRQLEPDLAAAPDIDVLWELMLPGNLLRRRAIAFQGGHPYSEEVQQLVNLTSSAKLAMLRSATVETWRSALEAIPDRLTYSVDARSAESRGTKYWLGGGYDYGDRIHVPTNNANQIAFLQLGYQIGGFDASTGEPLSLASLSELRGSAELNAYPPVSSRFRERYAKRLIWAILGIVGAAAFYFTRRSFVGWMAAMVMAAALCLVTRTVAGIYIWHLELSDAMLWTGAWIVVVLSAASLAMARRAWAILLACSVLLGASAAILRLGLTSLDLPHSVERWVTQI